MSGVKPEKTTGYIPDSYLLFIILKGVYFFLRKNKVMRMASVLLVAVLLTTCMISGTFAKYISSENVGTTGNARVAKWDVRFAADTDGLTADTAKMGSESFSAEINLFDTLYDTLNADYSAATPNEEHVAASNGTDKVIAPGTWGKFSFAIQNMSEVDATYTIEVKTTAGTLPIELSTNGTDWLTAEDFATAASNGGALEKNQATATKVTMYWRWAFTDTSDVEGTTNMDARDKADTALGIAAQNADAAKITLVVTATQVD